MKLKKSLFTLIISSAILFGLAIVTSTIVQAIPPKVNLTPSDYNTGISWDEAIKMDKPIVVNFYVDWCGYCKRFAPILENLRKEYQSKYSFVLINADDAKNKKLVKDFNISGYPSLYLVNPKNDNRVFVNQSLYSNAELLKKELNRYINKNN
ncbi:MAG: hypothetical protein A2287_09050 [Candidatus Melainabacteria bacterium RIFOXYA12_FULL_32_12]|nr:MAG: hypothetical protein A2255_02180 [Candidatus Melainabacteria bacterium RIFOXYA2_FULL_32_9]OGI24610.1 MAG: hypothetical protein A2287_09050 [Candidatus Melainabacteria bacterium RIFOXYA12_FULL_32_12]